MNKYLFIFVCLSALIFSVHSGFAQLLDAQDIAVIEARLNEKLLVNDKVEKTSITLKIAINGMFRGYKNFVSSQDASSCSFYPSCSEYFVASVGRYGFLKGSLLFGDRFQRCNSLSKENYPVYERTNLLFDPLPCDHGNCNDNH